MSFEYPEARILAAQLDEVLQGKTIESYHIKDYEKLQIPDIRKGRSHVLVEGTGMFVEALGKEVINQDLLAFVRS